MTNIYDKHAKAFELVSAWVIFDAKHELIAKVSVKYPVDGGGRVHAYVHIHGTTMQTAWAGGGGYDKAGAAINKAAVQCELALDADTPAYQTDTTRKTLSIALRKSNWENAVREAGFYITQAI